jgi:HEPN domain-containing protein
MKEEVVLRWLKKAENDLKTVKHLLTLEDAPMDVISFHCQQAVEKYFKAYLTLIDVRVTKTHDLETILALCIEKDTKFERLDKDGISKLTFYAVEIRYPEEYIEFSIEEARELYETAKEVKGFVMLRLKEKGLKWQNESL